MKIGFIGLGNVGGKLAASLLRNKFDIAVIDLDDNLVNDFVSKGSKTANSPKELAEKVQKLEKQKYESLEKAIEEQCSKADNFSGTYSYYMTLPGGGIEKGIVKVRKNKESINRDK